MEVFLGILAVLQGMAISLGVGSSTLAIINYFIAVSDGHIDDTEKKMMNVVYIVLRVAMALIFLSSFMLYITNHHSIHDLSAGFQIGVWSTIVVLYTNAVLMTTHRISSTIGPALQASTWYTLGGLMSLNILGFTNIKFLQFLVGYLTAITLAVAIVNGLVAYLKHKREMSL